MAPHSQSVLPRSLTKDSDSEANSELGSLQLVTQPHPAGPDRAAKCRKAISYIVCGLVVLFAIASTPIETSDKILVHHQWSQRFVPQANDSSDDICPVSNVTSAGDNFRLQGVVFNFTDLMAEMVSALCTDQNCSDDFLKEMDCTVQASLCQPRPGNDCGFEHGPPEAGICIPEIFQLNPDAFYLLPDVSAWDAFKKFKKGENQHHECGEQDNQDLAQVLSELEIDGGNSEADGDRTEVVPTGNHANMPPRSTPLKRAGEAIAASSVPYGRLASSLLRRATQNFNLGRALRAVSRATSEDAYKADEKNRSSRPRWQKDEYDKCMTKTCLKGAVEHCKNLTDTENMDTVMKKTCEICTEDDHKRNANLVKHCTDVSQREALAFYVLCGLLLFCILAAMAIPTTRHCRRKRDVKKAKKANAQDKGKAALVRPRHESHDPDMIEEEPPLPFPAQPAAKPWLFHILPEPRRPSPLVSGPGSGATYAPSRHPPQGSWYQRFMPSNRHVSNTVTVEHGANDQETSHHTASGARDGDAGNSQRLRAEQGGPGIRPRHDHKLDQDSTEMDILSPRSRARRVVGGSPLKEVDANSLDENRGSSVNEHRESPEDALPHPFKLGSQSSLRSGSTGREPTSSDMNFRSYVKSL
ncbi:hypothetical protein MMC20_003598 [Loxospora ochrophaea]|nr:hypothetical protein [Loxospora ochrophaea]